MNKEKLIRQYWRSTETIPFSGCWIYLGSLTTGGYASIRFKAYETLVGEIPAKMELHHKCKVRSCWNPQHLKLVTKEEHYRLHGKGDIIVPLEIKSGPVYKYLQQIN